MVAPAETAAAAQERAAQRWSSRLSLLALALGVACVVTAVAWTTASPAWSRWSGALLIIAAPTLAFVGMVLGAVARRWLLIAANLIPLLAVPLLLGAGR